MFSMLRTSNTTTTRSMSVTYCCYTFNINTVSYQYCSYLYYRKIHLRRYICCYVLLAYNDSVILLCFTLNCPGTLLFSKISNLFICGIFGHNLFAPDEEIHYLQFLIINNKCRNQVPVTKTKWPLKYGALSGVGWLWWGRSWLRHK